MTTKLIPGQLYFITDKSNLDTIWLKYSFYDQHSIKNLSLPITLLFIGDKSHMGCCSNVGVTNKYCICNQEFLHGDKVIILKKIFILKTFKTVQCYHAKTGKAQGVDFKKIRTVEYLADRLQRCP